MTDIKFSTKGAFGHIHLNRPNALNSLNIDMIRQIDDALSQVLDDNNLIGVFFTGEGKAFCAGGDVKAAYKAGLDFKSGKTTESAALQFFEEEYALNKRLVHFPKMTVAVMDGITMGGGVGLAGPCHHRICTENTVWAMPETTIGFFPDIGGAWYLAHAGDAIGMYLGLTALSVKNPRDLLEYGFATNCILHADIDSFLTQLEGVSSEKGALRHIEDMSKSFSGEGGLQSLSSKINDAFTKKSVSEIMSFLKEDGGAWSTETLQLLEQKSPISLLTAFAHIKQAGKESLDETLHRDHELAKIFMEGNDYYEGVRALLIDKDKTPRWQSYDLEKGLPPEINALFL
ncbi:MAG: 3-hydroxyisobutyryl-CoA hydrolase [Micavibrio sp.]|nr:3-hydroxyisobutyryl-CoA hydrolase [Micavibrio sp.]